MDYEDEEEKFTLRVAPIKPAVVVKPSIYESSRIFKVCSAGTDKIFIASTTSALSKKMSGYRKSYKVFKDTGKVKDKERSLMTIMEAGNPFIVLIDPFVCKTKEELNKEENRIMELHKTTAINRFDKSDRDDAREEAKLVQCPYCDDRKPRLYMTNHIIWNHKGKNSTSWEHEDRDLRRFSRFVNAVVNDKLTS